MLFVTFLWGKYNDALGGESEITGVVIDDQIFSISHIDSLKLGGRGLDSLLRIFSKPKPSGSAMDLHILDDDYDDKRPQFSGSWSEVADIVKNHEPKLSVDLTNARIKSPLLNPASIRDFYAFEQHVKTANENRGREVPKEWYEIPVFYFTNHTAIFGPGDVIPYPIGSEKLDYELEVAAVIGKAGSNIKPEEAEDYIFGYMIYNDWSARDIQAQEMRVGLGPAKGKDFAQSFGPYLVTPDELVDRHTGRPGVYDLQMVARVNGQEMSRGNWKDLHYSFGDMLARASAGVTLYPGDVIGSGTVGTGCLLEITKGQGPYLQPGDVVELEIERLGILRNTVGEKQG